MNIIEKRANKYADDIATTEERGWMDRSDIYEIAKDAHLAGATEQKAIDIDEIPQLYVRWLMIDGEKPSWIEYANKAMEG